MNHQQMKDWQVLSHYGELDAGQERELQEHLRNCPECRREQADLESFHRLLEEDLLQPDPHLLEQARAQLRGALSQERPLRTTSWRRFLSGINLDWLYGGRAVGLTLASALIGILIGTMFLGSGTPGRQSADPELQARLTGLDILNQDLSERDLELIYRTVGRLRPLSGDAGVEQILTQALVSVDNPGVRMRVVNALEDRSAGIDPQVQRSLIDVLKNDANVGVRLRALAVLSELSFDDSLKEAFIYTLVNDPNPGMRVAAINVLAVKAGQGISLGAELLGRLAGGLEGETNDFIRRRSEEFLQEVQYR